DPPAPAMALSRKTPGRNAVDIYLSARAECPSPHERRADGPRGRTSRHGPIPGRACSRALRRRTAWRLRYRELERRDETGFRSCPATFDDGLPRPVPPAGGHVGSHMGDGEASLPRYYQCTSRTVDARDQLAENAGRG